MAAPHAAPAHRNEGGRKNPIRACTLFWVSSLGLGSLLIGCNALWGIDDLDYTGGAGGLGGTAGGGGHAAQGGIAGFVAGGGYAGTGGGGANPCADICTSPPNTDCYEPVGSCDPQSGGCIYTMLADGTTCGDTTCTNWGSCAWGGECSSTGSRSRMCTDHQCAAGVCAAADRPDVDGCARVVLDGTACGADGYCCSNTCVARSSIEHCGSCGIDCGIQTCVEIIGQAGQYSCTCASNQFCRDSGFGPLATCWDSGTQMLCNCQCSTGSSCSGQCAGGGICADVTGHNYCHY